MRTLLGLLVVAACTNQGQSRTIERLAEEAEACKLKLADVRSRLEQQEYALLASDIFKGRELILFTFHGAAALTQCETERDRRLSAYGPSGGFPLFCRKQ